MSPQLSHHINLSTKVKNGVWPRSLQSTVWTLQKTQSQLCSTSGWVWLSLLIGRCKICVKLLSQIAQFSSGSYQDQNQTHYWLCVQCFTWFCPIRIQNLNKRHWCLQSVLTGKRQRRKHQNQLGQCVLFEVHEAKLRGHGLHSPREIPTLLSRYV